ncbi:MAG TPA: homoserine kinase [Chloroflexota bacterium]|nr:homoserine kinase [Chloroflexota bacterium]
MTSAPDPAPIRVLVPATSANLGPGFDCMAIALDLFTTVEILPPSGSRAITVEVAGEGAETLSTGQDNLVLRAMRLLAGSYNCALPPMHLRVTNAIPLGRGLGSSAAAIVGGLFAGATLLGLPTHLEALLPLALQLEGHPDNIAAALLGGFTIGVLHGESALIRRIDPPPSLAIVLLVPDCFASTLEARAILPETVSRADAIFTASRCALLAADLAAGRLDALSLAMEDRLHQPYRARTFPYLPEAIAAARMAGAYGAALSGAGSSVIALTSARTDDVAAALAAVADRYHLPARTMVLRPEPRGAHRA